MLDRSGLHIEVPAVASKEPRGSDAGTTAVSIHARAESQHVAGTVRYRCLKCNHRV